MQCFHLNVGKDSETTLPPGTIALKISTCHKVQFGEVVKIVGEGDQLGSWDPFAAPGMSTV